MLMMKEIDIIKNINYNLLLTIKRFRQSYMNKEKYVEAIEKYLIAKYGKLQDEWRVLIDLFVENLELYIQCKEVINKVGIYNYDKGKKNPLLGVLKETTQTLLKISQQLTISPWSASKIRNIDGDNTEDFIEALIS